MWFPRRTVHLNIDMILNFNGLPTIDLGHLTADPKNIKEELKQQITVMSYNTGGLDGLN